MEKYNVVFRYTKETGGFHGVRTWTSFENKEKFKEWYTEDKKRRQTIIEKGVSRKKAIELAEGTPIAYRIAACKQEATTADGVFHKKVFEIKMATLLFAKKPS